MEKKEGFMVKLKEKCCPLNFISKKMKWNCNK